MVRASLKKLIIASIVLLPIIVLLLLKFVFVSPEEKIRRVIHSVVEAFEAEDTEGTLGCLSKDYSDNMGLDYPRLAQLLEETFGNFDGLRVFLSELKVEVDKETGRANLKLAVLGKLEGAPLFLLGSFNQPVSTEVLFRREEKEWKIVEATLR